MAKGPRGWLTRVETNFYNLTRHMAWRFRLDGLFISGAILFITITLVAWTSYTVLGTQRGWFDPPLIAPLADDRILTNIRKEIDQHPLLAAVWHAASQQIVIAQSGNQVHWYQPDNGIWWTETPLAGSPLIHSDIYQLRSGCGGPDDSDFECPNPNVLWALTRQGALLSHTFGQWHALTTETQFLDASNQPVQQDDLTTAAISDDSRMLIVATRTAGAGVYDIQQRRWLYSIRPIFERAPQNEVTHLVAWDGKFWFGGPGGLAEMAQSGTRPARVEAIAGSILDLDVINGTLWALEQGPCEAGDKSCIRILRWRPLLGPEVIFEERNNYPTVNLSSLSHIQAWGTQVLLAGSAGVYHYDPDGHSWAQFSDLNILSFLPGNDSFTFGYAGGVGFLKVGADAPTLLPLEGERIIQITISNLPGEAIALAGSGNAYRLNLNDQTVVPFFTVDHSQIEPTSFLSAAAVDSQVFMAGPQGAVLYNVERPQYQTIAARILPDWLTAGAPRWVVAAAHAYAILNDSADPVTIYPVPTTILLNPTSPADQWAAINPVTLPGPARASWSNSRGLSLLAADGRVYEVRANQAVAQTGPSEPDLNNASLQDVTLFGTDLVVVTEDGLRRYSLPDRDWGRLFDQNAGPRVTEIDGLSGRLVARTEAGQLVQFSNNQRQLLIGGGGFRLSDADISDAWLVGDQLYIAGQGWVERYDFGLRRVDQTWSLNQSGAMRIVGIVNNQPWTILNAQLYYGQDRISSSSDSLLSASLQGDAVWAVYQGRAADYVRAFNSSQPYQSSTCYFYSATLGNASIQVWDARTIASTGNVLTATSDGLFLYDLSHRSWYRASGTTPLPTGTRLYAMDTWLVLAIPDNQGFELQFIDTNSLAPDDTCAETLSIALGSTITAAQVDFDEPNQRFAWIEANGSVHEFAGGQTRVVLPASSTGPDPSLIRGVYTEPDPSSRLWAIADQSLWRYDLSRREWQSVSLAGLPAGDAVVSLNISQAANQSRLVAQLESGAFYVGPLGAGQTQVSLDQLYRPTNTTFDGPPSELLKVFMVDSRYWSFLLSDRILFYDSAFRTWQTPLMLPAGTQAVDVSEAFGRLIIHDAANSAWLVADSIETMTNRYYVWPVTPDQIHALSSEGGIWTFNTVTGEIEACQPGVGINYDCTLLTLTLYKNMWVENDGRLMAERADGTTVPLADQAMMEPNPAQSLDVGWLRWDSARREFLIRDAGGQVKATYAPSDFIVNGQMLFEPVAALQFDSADTPLAGNAFGVWEYSSSALSPNVQVNFAPYSWALPIGSDHDNFVSGNATYRFLNGQIQPSASTVILKVGDATFYNDSINRTVSSTVTVVSDTIPAWTPDGFIWDIGRRGVAYIENNLWLQSDAGLNQINQLSGFDPTPTGQAQLAPAIQTESVTSGSQVRRFYSFDGQTWYERQVAGWIQATISPRRQRVVVNSPFWQWEVTGGQLRVTLATGLPGFSVKHDQSGLGFSIDRLQAAAAYDGRLFFMSEATLQIANVTNPVGMFGGQFLSGQSSDLLDVFHFGDGTLQLYRVADETVTEWNEASQSFNAVRETDNPYQHRLLVNSDRLRLTWLGTTVQKELRVDRFPAGEATWVTFNFLPGNLFPFDAITSLATLNNKLYLGSTAGLQVYSGTDVNLNRLTVLLDMRGQPSGALAPVQEVGRPADDPNKVMAISEAQCVEQTATSPFVACPNPTQLQDRLRAESALWRWTASQDGDLSGVYKATNTSSPVGTKVAISDGRWLHDQIDTAIVCQGRLFMLWGGRWISVFQSDDVALTELTDNHLLPEAQLERLVCLEQAIVLPGQSVPAGVYALGRQALYFDGQAWSPVTDNDQVAVLENRVVQPPIYEAGRLRLLPFTAEAGPVFEHRSNDGQWSPITWNKDVLGTDTWRQVIAVNNQLWIATAAGLINVERGSDGSFFINPANVLLLTEPETNGQPCFVTDSVARASEVWLRCEFNSARVFRGTLDATQDKGVFTKAASDPFLEAELISGTNNSPWLWRRLDRSQGRPGVLEGFLCLPVGSATGERLCETRIDLSNGHFSFDRLTTLGALNGDPTLDIAANGSNWFQSASDSLALKNWIKPSSDRPDDQAVEQVAIGRIGDRPVLCLQTAAGTYALLSHTDKPIKQACQLFWGDDGFWRYEGSPEGLIVTAYGEKSQGGTAQRVLSNGRFLDDVVIGLPVTGSIDDKVYYAVPTQAGILWWDKDWTPYRIDVGPFAGLAEAELPKALLVTVTGWPAYATPQGVYELDLARTKLEQYKLPIERLDVLFMEPGPQSQIRYAWQSPVGLQWSFQDPIGSANCTVERVNSLCLNLLTVGLQTSSAVDEPARNPLLVLEIGSNHLEARSPDHTESFVVKYPADLKLVDVVLRKTEAFLIGRDEIYVIDLQVLLKRLGSGS